MHHIDKQGRAKPNIFSHVHSRGCSIQRDTIASTNELTKFVNDFLSSEDRIWKGVLVASCAEVRNIKAAGEHRAVCVYDSANVKNRNPAHGELCQTQYVIEEADKIELRHNLLEAFGKGMIHGPQNFRNGEIWNSLPADIQNRQ